MPLTDYVACTASAQRKKQCHARVGRRRLVAHDVPALCDGVGHEPAVAVHGDARAHRRVKRGGALGARVPVRLAPARTARAPLAQRFASWVINVVLCAGAWRS
jgi:hypothetical protein